MPTPCFKRLPVFFDHRLFLFFIGILLLIKRSLSIFQSILLADTVHGLLKCRDLSNPSVFPKYNCAFIICAGKHRAQIIPPDTVNRA